MSRMGRGQSPVQCYWYSSESCCWHCSRKYSTAAGEGVEATPCGHSGVMTTSGVDGGDAPGIGERIERLEAVAGTLEEGEVDLETAKELREEADDHLAALREELDVGDGEIIEVDTEDVNLGTE